MTDRLENNRREALAIRLELSRTSRPPVGLQDESEKVGAGAVTESPETGQEISHSPSGVRRIARKTSSFSPS